MEDLSSPSIISPLFPGYQNFRLLEEEGSLANVVSSAHLVCSFFADSYMDLKAH